MVQYYTLEEAARFLGMSPDELKALARRGELRPFQDRGTMRFRAQEIEELARRRGRGSDPDLPLGEATRPKPADSPAPVKGGPPKEVPPDQGVVNLSLDSEQVEIGREASLDPPGGRKGQGGGSGSGRKTGVGKPPGGKSGSDSDVRLVADGSDLSFQLATDSDVVMVDDSGASSSKRSLPSSSKSGPKKTAGPPADQPDSGVRLIPLEGEGVSDVRVVDEHEDSTVSLGKPPGKTASDSDVRLEPDSASRVRPGSDKRKREAPLTEEIDLDAEMRQAEEKTKTKGSSGKHRALAAQAGLPTTSPYELAEDEAPAPAPAAGPKKRPATDSSADFELTPAGGEQSPLELGSDEEITLSSDEEIQIKADDDEVTLGELTGSGGGSGINLQKPSDKGISLEDSAGSDEFELDLSPGEGATPKPGAAKGPQPDSSDEFELSLEDSGEQEAPGADSSGEFELSLEDSGEQPAAEDSESEFELTLDDSGGLVPLEEAAADEGGEEKDIFETDFEVPALEDESGSEAMALDESDTDLETSDFDLALNDDDIAAEDSSGSQVVALEDEEEVDDAAATVSRQALADEDVGEFDNLDLEGEEAAVEEEVDEEAAVAAPAAKPTRWGTMPALVMLPCVLLMFLVGLVGWEMVNLMWANHQNQKVTGFLAPWLAYDVFGMEKVKD